MKDFEELRQWCEDHDAWLTFNFYKGKYKCFVNPGTKMTVAPWYESKEEAIAACWAAIGGKPDPMPNELISLQEQHDTLVDVLIERGKLDYSNASNIQAPYSADHVNELTEKALGLIDAMPKKRGRPKGSKNKPKESA
jgi:hypothetical protein